MLPSQKRAYILKTYSLNGPHSITNVYVSVKIMKIEHVSKVCLQVQW